METKVDIREIPENELRAVWVSLEIWRHMDRVNQSLYWTCGAIGRYEVRRDQFRWWNLYRDGVFMAEGMCRQHLADAVWVLLKEREKLVVVGVA